MATIGKTRFGIAPWLPNTGFVNFALDGTTDGIGTVFQAEVGLTITQVGVRQGVVTGTAPTYKIGFQGIGADGNPNGTWEGGGSEQSTTFTPTAGNDGTFQWFTLDNAKTVTRGEFLALVVEYSSGTINTSNHCTFTLATRKFGLGSELFPYGITESAGVWTKDDDGPIYGYRSSTATYGQVINDETVLTIDDDATPDESGLAFTMPSGACTSYQVVGLYGFLDWDGGTGDTLTYSLYQDTTLLQQSTLVGERTSSVSNELYWLIFDETTLSSLSPGTEYILALKSSSTTAAINLITTDYPVAQDATGSAFKLQKFSPRRAERTDSGAWSFNATIVPDLSPLVIDLVTSAGVEITPDNGDLALSATAPTRVSASLRNPTQANLSLSAVAPTKTRTSTALPSQGDLALSATAPTRLTSSLRAVPVAALVLSSFAPTVLTPRTISPASGDLSLSSQAPSRAIGHVANPPQANLALDTQAPTRLNASVRLPAAGDLVLDTQAPTITGDTQISPPQANLILDAQAPTRLTASLRLPAAADLTLSTVAPSVSGATSIAPPSADLLLSSTAPTRINTSVRLPGVADLALSSTAPTRTISSVRLPGAANLALSSTIPTRVTASSRLPAAANLTLSSVAPSVGESISISPPSADLALSATAPTRLSASVRLPAAADLTLSTVAPSVGGAVNITPAAGDLVLSSAAPTRSNASTRLPAVGNITLSSVAPLRVVSSLRVPGAVDLVLSATAPVVGGSVTISPAAGSLTLTSTAPSVLSAQLVALSQYTWDVLFLSRAWDVEMRRV